MSRRRKYRFTGREGDNYYWEGPETGDGRVEIVSCSVAWFWGQR